MLVPRCRLAIAGVPTVAAVTVPAAALAVLARFTVRQGDGDACLR